MLNAPLFVWLRLLGVAVGVIVCALSLMLLFVCVTRPGMAFAIAGLALGGAMILGAIAIEQPSKSWRRAALCCLSTWAIVTAWLWAQAPDGHTSPQSQVQHRFLNGQWTFSEHALGNLLPEIDQFRLGFKLVPAIDPLFTHQQGERLAGWTSAIYDELEADPNFHALGSVMPLAYDELWGQEFDRGHYLLYQPKGGSSRPKPALIFLHGSGGNFKAYSWILSQVADELGMVLIAPTFGMGNWREPATSRLIGSALQDAKKIASIDLDQVHLMGLSNGGLGVSQAGFRLGKQLRSLCFVSPVFERMTIGTPEFTALWAGRPVLVLSGNQDDRVPIDYVQDSVKMMESTKIDVHFKNVADADHFMLFSHRQQVVQTIIEWLRPQLKTTPASS